MRLVHEEKTPTEVNISTSEFHSSLTSIDSEFVRFIDDTNDNDEFIESFNKYIH